MSWEGYYQVLCKKGHLFSADPYTCDMYDSAHHHTPLCPCGEPAVWYNSVDTTNGSFGEDDHGHEVRIDGYIPDDAFVLLTPAEYCTCDKCQHRHMTIMPTYAPPPGLGQKWSRGGSC